MSAWIASAGAPLRGRIRVPGDKSVSHRAVMLGALANGTTRIEGFLEGEDTRATARVFAAMGVRIESPAESVRLVHGVGLHGLASPTGVLDCGNAGTGMRLLAGLLCGQRFDSVLVGDESLSRRPMRRVIEPLSSMGARIDGRESGLPPLQVHGGRPLRGIELRTPVASAQVKSAVLLAGLYADGATTVIEPTPTRDYTERMLRAFGADIEFVPGTATLRPGAELHARDVAVPADFSSAAFFVVAATLVPGSELVIESVGVNARRTGLLQALGLMGADIEVVDASEVGGEPVADLRVRHAALRGIDVPVELVPDMIDEFPALFAAAAVAQGDTHVRGAAELRVKESDRIAAMATGLRALGIEVDETPDGACIRGGTVSGGTIDSRGDHRIAMSFSVLAQRARGEVRIDDVANVATSFPRFEDLATATGMAVRAA